MENIKEAIKYIMVGAVVIAELDSGSIGPGSSPRWGHCDTLSHEVTVGKKLNFCSASLHSVVAKCQGNLTILGVTKPGGGNSPIKMTGVLVIAIWGQNLTPGTAWGVKI